MANPTEEQIVARQIVRAKVTVGSASFPCQSFDPAANDSVDTVEVRTVGASKTAYLPGSVKNTAAVEVKILDNGTPAPTVGAMVDLKIEAAYSENGKAEEAAETLTVPCFVQAVTADKIEAAGGSRLKAWTVVLQPTNLESVSPAAL